MGGLAAVVVGQGVSGNSLVLAVGVGVGVSVGVGFAPLGKRGRELGGGG